MRNTDLAMSWVELGSSFVTHCFVNGRNPINMHFFHKYMFSKFEWYCDLIFNIFVSHIISCIISIYNIYNQIGHTRKFCFSFGLMNRIDKI